MTRCPRSSAVLDDMAADVTGRTGDKDRFLCIHASSFFLLVRKVGIGPRQVQRIQEKRRRFPFLLCRAARKKSRPAARFCKRAQRGRAAFPRPRRRNPGRRRCPAAGASTKVMSSALRSAQTTASPRPFGLGRGGRVFGLRPGRAARPAARRNAGHFRAGGCWTPAQSGGRLRSGCRLRGVLPQTPRR